MGFVEWGVNLLILSFVINAALLVVNPELNPSMFGCVKALWPLEDRSALEDLYPSENGISGTCAVSFIQPPELTGVTDTADLPNEVIALLFAIPQLVLYILNLIVIIIFILSSFLLTGWLNIHYILFLGLPEISGVFFIFAVLLTMIQLFAVLFLVSQIVQQLRR